MPALSSSATMSILLASSTALPGASPASAPAPPIGLARLSPKLISLLTAAKVPEKQMTDLGDAEVDCVATFANIAPTKQLLCECFRDVLGVDPGPTKKADFALRAQLLSAWQACLS